MPQAAASEAKATAWVGPTGGRPGHPEPPVRTVGHRQDSFELLGTDLVAHAPSVQPGQYPPQPPSPCIVVLHKDSRWRRSATRFTGVRCRECQGRTVLEPGLVGCPAGGWVAARAASRWVRMSGMICSLLPIRDSQPHSQLARCWPLGPRA
jgi:hypothetical protein